MKCLSGTNNDEQVNWCRLWPSIGATLGLIPLPGDADEFACGAELALGAHLKHVYERFLLKFDENYSNQFFHWIRQYRSAQRHKNAIGTGHDMTSGVVPENGPPDYVQHPEQQQTAARITQKPTPRSGLTEKQLQYAMEMAKRLREESRSMCIDFMGSMFHADSARSDVTPRAGRTIQIPDAQRIEYHALFDQLHDTLCEVDKRLPHYAVVFMMEDSTLR